MFGAGRPQARLGPFDEVGEVLAGQVAVHDAVAQVEAGPAADRVETVPASFGVAKLAKP